MKPELVLEVKEKGRDILKQRVHFQVKLGGSDIHEHEPANYPRTPGVFWLVVRRE